MKLGNARGDGFLLALLEHLGESPTVLSIDSIGIEYLDEKIREIELIIATVESKRQREALITHALHSFPVRGYTTLTDSIKRVKVLQVMYNPSSKCTPISVFCNLTSVTLNDLDVSQVKGLAVLRDQLEHLQIVAQLQSLPHLLNECLGDISQPLPWTMLRSLKLPNNLINNMDDCLQLLSSIEDVDLSRNQITELTNLSYCHTLLHLDMSYNLLSSMELVYLSLGNVQELNLTGNSITHTQGLERLMGLQRLNLSENLIADFVNIENLAGMPSLQELDLSLNSIAAHRDYRIRLFSIFQSHNRALLLDGKKLFNCEEVFQDVAASFWTEKALSEQSDRPKNNSKVIVKRDSRRKKMISLEPVTSTTPCIVDDDLRSASDFQSHVSELKKELGEMWMSALVNERRGIDEEMKVPYSSQVVVTHDMVDPEAIVDDDLELPEEFAGMVDFEEHEDILDQSVDFEEVLETLEVLVKIRGEMSILCINEASGIRETGMIRSDPLFEYSIQDIVSTETSINDTGFWLTVTLDSKTTRVYGFEDEDTLMEVSSIFNESPDVRRMSDVMLPSDDELIPSVSTGRKSISRGALFKSIEFREHYFSFDNTSEDMFSEENSVIQRFMTEFKTGDISEQFSSRFQIPVVQLYKPSRIERDTIVLLVDSELYVMSTCKVRNTVAVSVESRKNLTDVTKIVLGLFMRYLVLEFDDNSSFIFFTREQTLTNSIFQAISSHISTGTHMLISNRDEIVLEAIQTTVFHSDRESLKLYELVFLVDNSTLESIPVSLIFSNMNMYVCEQTFGSIPAFKPVGSAMPLNKFVTLDASQMKYNGEFALVFGSRRGFGTSSSGVDRTQWRFRTPNEHVFDQITAFTNELAR